MATNHQPLFHERRIFAGGGTGSGGGGGDNDEQREGETGRGGPHGVRPLPTPASRGLQDT